MPKVSAAKFLEGIRHDCAYLGKWGHLPGQRNHSKANYPSRPSINSSPRYPKGSVLEFLHNPHASAMALIERSPSPASKTEKTALPSPRIALDFSNDPDASAIGALEKIHKTPEPQVRIEVIEVDEFLAPSSKPEEAEKEEAA